MLQINALTINGSNADIYGTGGINTDNKDIKMQLELRLLKTASSVIANIPIINHILLGENKVASTIIEVFGTYDDPKYKSTVAVDILSTPYNIIKNTLSLPANLFK